MNIKNLVGHQEFRLQILDTSRIWRQNQEFEDETETVLCLGPVVRGARRVAFATLGPQPRFSCVPVASSATIFGSSILPSEHQYFENVIKNLEMGSRI